MKFTIKNIFRYKMLRVLASKSRPLINNQLRAAVGSINNLSTSSNKKAIYAVQSEEEFKVRNFSILNLSSAFVTTVQYLQFDIINYHISFFPVNLSDLKRQTDFWTSLKMLAKLVSFWRMLLYKEMERHTSCYSNVRIMIAKTLN